MVTVVFRKNPRSKVGTLERKQQQCLPAARYPSCLQPPRSDNKKHTPGLEVPAWDTSFRSPNPGAVRAGSCRCSHILQCVWVHYSSHFIDIHLFSVLITPAGSRQLYGCLIKRSGVRVLQPYQCHVQKAKCACLWALCPYCSLGADSSLSKVAHQIPFFCPKSEVKLAASHLIDGSFPLCAGLCKGHVRNNQLENWKSVGAG